MAGIVDDAHFGLLSSHCFDHEHVLVLFGLNPFLVDGLLLIKHVFVDHLGWVQELREPANTVTASLSRTRGSKGSILKPDGLTLVDATVIAPHQLELRINLDIHVRHLLPSEAGIKRHLEHVIEHIEHELLILRFKHRPHVRTSVDLDQPDPQVLVEYEVKANDLELLTLAVVGVVFVQS